MTSTLGCARAVARGAIAAALAVACNGASSGATPTSSPPSIAPTGPSASSAASDGGALPPPGEPAARWASAALPPLDASTIDHVLRTHAVGQSKMNRDDVVMKTGDSITASTRFFFDLGVGNYTLGATYASLGPMIESIRKITFDDNSTPFDRQSIAAESGLITKDALARDLVRQEISAIRPSWAILMFGSDDLENYGADVFKGYLGTILDQLEGEGVVVAISTIPRRLEYQNGDQLVSDYNAAIKAIAADRHLPLIDLFAALEPLANHGIGDDDVHPTVELAADGGSESADFTPPGLAYGYNLRNLTALEMLDRLRAITRGR